MMLAALYVRAGAALPLEVFIFGGIGVCLVWLWWCWWTLGECPHCSQTPRECRCEHHKTRIY